MPIHHYKYDFTLPAPEYTGIGAWFIPRAMIQLLHHSGYGVATMICNIFAHEAA
jgi:hypothetical protein